MGSEVSELRAQRTELLRYVGRRVGDPALREDIVQEAYLRLLTYQAQPGNRVTNAVGLLRSISLNLVRDYFRRTERSATVAMAEDLACPVTDLARQAEQRELIAIVARVLGRMPRLRREIFICRRVHGYSAKEAAEQFGISPAAVDMHVVRAVLDLNAAMEKLEKRGQSAGR